MQKRYTETERSFILALALATRKPFTALAPVVRGLAEHQCLAWLGPGANERFADWPAQRGYEWAKRYGWELQDVEAEDAAPLPPEEQIDDDLLRNREKLKELFLEKLVSGVGDPHKNSNAFIRLGDQIEQQITRRMSRHLTPNTIIDLVFDVLKKLGGQDVDEAAVLQAIAEEVNRYRYLPASPGQVG